MGVNFNVDSQLERLDTKAGNMTAALKQDFTGDLNYKMQIPAKSGQQAGTAASVETTGNISGIAKVNFLVNKGRVLSSTGNIGMHMNVNCVPQGDNAQSGTMAMDMAMTMEMFQLPSASLR